MLQVLNRRAEIAERVLEREKSYLTTLASLILFHVFVLVRSLFTDRENSPRLSSLRKQQQQQQQQRSEEGRLFLQAKVIQEPLGYKPNLPVSRMATPFIFEKKCLEYLPMYSGG